MKRLACIDYKFLGILILNPEEVLRRLISVSQLFMSERSGQPRPVRHSQIGGGRANSENRNLG